MTAFKDEDYVAPEGEEQEEERVEVKDTEQNRRTIKRAANAILKLEAERKSIGDQIKVEREKVVALGVPRAAFKRALSRYKLTETDREEQEFGYQVCVKALGVEHQEDLF